MAFVRVPLDSDDRSPLESEKSGEKTFLDSNKGTVVNSFHVEAEQA